MSYKGVIKDVQHLTTEMKKSEDLMELLKERGAKEIYKTVKKDALIAVGVACVTCFVIGIGTGVVMHSIAKKAKEKKEMEV